MATSRDWEWLSHLDPARKKCLWLAHHQPPHMSRTLGYWPSEEPQTSFDEGSLLFNFARLCSGKMCPLLSLPPSSSFPRCWSGVSCSCADCQSATPIQFSLSYPRLWCLQMKLVSVPLSRCSLWAYCVLTLHIDSVHQIPNSFPLSCVVQLTSCWDKHCNTMLGAKSLAHRLLGCT